MRINITLLFILFLVQSNAQQITWNKKFFQPIKHFNAAISINQLPDSGFIIIANKYNVGSYGKLIRTNKYGDSIWVKIIEVTQKLITTYDNGFMLSGYDSNGSFLKKLNSNGDTIWKKYYPYLSACYVAQSIDSGYILCGSNFVLKTDSLGNTVWTTPCIGNFNNVVIGYNDNILVVGGINNSYLAMLLDKNGSIIWTKNYGTLSTITGINMRIINAVQLTDSNFATINSTCQLTPIVGWNYMTIDRNNGDTIFSKSFPGSCLDDNFANITNSNDSNLFICLESEIIKMSPSGNILWSNYNSHNLYFSIARCNDNGAAAGGSYWWYDQPGEPFFEQSVVVKLDSLGKLNPTSGMYSHKNTGNYLYPNPVKTAFSLNHLLSSEKIVTVTIYDAFGKEKMKHTNVSGIDHTYPFDVSYFEQGIYFLEILAPTEVFRYKFIKE